jgi:hypothetical protein
MSSKPTADQLAAIAAQFIIAGDDQAEALTKANRLYFAAVDYLNHFTAMSAAERAMEIDPRKALLEAAEREDLAVGDSEEHSPALRHFRATAKTKTEQNTLHQAFTNLIQREFGRLPETIAPAGLENLHDRLRVKRSQARSKRRKKSVK